MSPSFWSEARVEHPAPRDDLRSETMVGREEALLTAEQLEGVRPNIQRPTSPPLVLPSAENGAPQPVANKGSECALGDLAPMSAKATCEARAPTLLLSGPLATPTTRRPAAIEAAPAIEVAELDVVRKYASPRPPEPGRMLADGSGARGTMPEKPVRAGECGERWLNVEAKFEVDL
mmetsp:Transcript_9304/g.28162  ORF Transcript_9304/g.28162 Transcript_9304/m.28162 type:complete len:176 (+) Transcript_9304:1185-1712(+)